MDSKLASNLCRCVIGVCLFITYVLAQPPPPPEMPTDTEQIRLDSTIPDKSNTGLPDCTDIICTMEYIPVECRENPILQRNGVNCTGCPQWKESCKTGQNTTRESSQVDVTCPIVSCPNVKIPAECVEIETYLYLGKTCDKCPTRKANCSSHVSANSEVKCPIQACTRQLIPAECRDVPTFNYNGITCNACPQWRPGCKPMIRGNQMFPGPRSSCPVIACDTYIPDECRVEQEYVYRGQMCRKCAKWREGCRETERRNSFISGPVDHFGNRVRQTPCPRFPCRELNVPMDCIQEQPFEYRGITCFKCPTVRPECRSANLMELNQITEVPELPCPVMKCDRRSDIPPNCYQPEEYIHRGKICQRCPSIKLECRIVEPPRPIVTVGPVINDRPDQPCPMLACPLIYIPPECRDMPTYQVDGKTCQGCPVFRDGCMPSLARPIPTPNTVFPEIPPRKPEIQCPVRACPMNDIPSECREEQPYQYQGLTCYDCPKWRESCRNLNVIPGRIVDVPSMACPMFGCPRIYIPPECREEQTFQYRGLTCNMCPKWREGCIPTGNKIVDPVDTSSTTPVPQIEPKLPEKSCPLIACPALYIPPECRQEQSYIFEGKTCYNCPTWREGCKENGRQASTTPSPNLQDFTIKPPTNPPSLTDLKGLIPVTKIIDTVNAAACPELRCPDMFIPLYCREESNYVYQGRTCRGCPRWRIGCNMMSNSPINSNPNGILSFSLFNELMAS